MKRTCFLSKFTRLAKIDKTQEITPFSDKMLLIKWETINHSKLFLENLRSVDSITNLHVHYIPFFFFNSDF